MSCDPVQQAVAVFHDNLGGLVVDIARLDHLWEQGDES